jgi:hypothetical protein
MAAGKLNIVDLDHALSAGFATGFLLARMVARLMTALATFFALKSRVHSFWMALGPATMTAVEPVNACLTATSLGAVLGKVVRFVDVHNLVRVSRAAQPQRRANRSVFAQHANNILPHIDGGVCVCIADEKHPMLRSTEENIDAIGSLQEPDIVLRVAAYQGYDYNFGLFALEVVNCRNP